jgi:hypothetical protein
MLEMLDHAQKGLYKPKNFTEEEMLCGLLFLLLGGACVASLAHQSLSGRAVSTLQCGSALVPLSPSVGIPSKDEIQCNLQAAFKCLHGELGCGYVLMIDEIKVVEVVMGPVLQQDSQLMSRAHPAYWKGFLFCE